MQDEKPQNAEQVEPELTKAAPEDAAAVRKAERKAAREKGVAEAEAFEASLTTVRLRVDLFDRAAGDIVRLSPKRLKEAGDAVESLTGDAAARAVALFGQTPATIA